MGNLRVLRFDPNTKTKLLIKYNQLKVKYRSNVKTDGCCFLQRFCKITVTFYRSKNNPPPSPNSHGWCSRLSILINQLISFLSMFSHFGRITFNSINPFLTFNTYMYTYYDNSANNRSDCYDGIFLLFVFGSKMICVLISVIRLQKFKLQPLYACIAIRYFKCPRPTFAFE